MPLSLTGAAKPALLELPWSLPLEEWPEPIVVALPRGISRHVVRFARMGERIIAIKETNPAIADREFAILRELRKLGAPCVKPVAVVRGREGDDGRELEAALVTEHLQFSLPYRALFSQALDEDTVRRFLDALAVLLVRLHLLGFYWGDVSLSNALFRRDAAEFSAYLVDAETGDLHAKLTDGQRAYDLEIARTNIAGELFDLEAQDVLETDIDPIDVANQLESRYTELWAALTETATFTSNIPMHIAARVRELNELGFDVGELDMRHTDDGNALVIRPKVVDAGHHARRLMRLTGLVVQENQARRLLNDLDEYRAVHGPHDEEGFVAHQWLAGVFEPTVRAVPREFRHKLEPPQIFHEVLDHRWFLAQAAGHDVAMAVATASYVKNILPNRPDELAVLGPSPASEMSAAEMTAELPALTSEIAGRPVEKFEGDNTARWGHDDDDVDTLTMEGPTVNRPTTKWPPPKREPRVSD